ncbi:MAG: hypothetical protein ABH863_01300 [Candidatus Micrarchaeota archaeon]
MRAFVLIFAIAAIFVSPAMAADISGHVQSVQPVQKLISGGDMLDLGIVGPGQKIEIEIARTSGINDFRNVEEVWDRLKIDDATLPLFWRSEYSLRYEANPKAFVIVDKGAPDGEYSFSLHTERDYGTASQYPVRFNAKVRISRDVFSLKVLSKFVQGGVEQPSEFTLELANKGSANDAFELEVVSGLPNAWKFKKQVFIPHGESRIVTYEVVSKEQVDAEVEFHATSLSSDTIYGTDTASLQTRSSVLQDMRSVGNGVILFPNIEQVVYYLMGFIANNFI